MNEMLQQFSHRRPGDVASGFLLLVGEEPAERWTFSEEVPWALFTSRTAAEEVAGAITPVQLLHGTATERTERVAPGDEFVIRLLEFRGGQRYDLTVLRRITITPEDLKAYAATLPRVAALR
ncbi:MAG: hypothetical protein L0Z62_26745 [Gemmataceae bacterium]|nr:hypothetical protein [Gemmataceae bacterium]